MKRTSRIAQVARIGLPAAVGAMLLGGCASAPATLDAEPRAKNVILFIGDGMGISTVTAARIFDGQSKGLAGEEHQLVFETFPNVALVKTYNSNQQVPDSAGTATAMMTGQKTRAGVINVAADVKRRDCAAALQSPLRPLSIDAKERGLAVGVVTTTRLTHATPATVYASMPERDWESDLYLSDADQARGCRDIARQLVEFAPGGGLDVALGGGRDKFFANDGERREAGSDLVSDWLAGGPGRTFVATRDELDRVTAGTQVLGLFADSHLEYIARRQADSTEPTLAEMTVKAIDLLAADEDGYFLMVEGGRIDHGHHIGKPGYAMLEAQAFNTAIGAALAKIDLTETLVLVTADHSHVFTIAGYPTRGNPILGLVVGNDKSGEPYTTLGYTNGPGGLDSHPRGEPETGIEALSQALSAPKGIDIAGAPYHAETHGGEDVALYATGPGAEHVRGVIEQNVIYSIMVDALGFEASTD